MQVLRTPDDRFADLPGYPFAPHYVEVSGAEGATLRMHYLDEGPPDGEVVLLLHGEPSWSYLYRRMVPILVAAGLRAVAIDLVGFGRSDNPAIAATTPTSPTSTGPGPPSRPSPPSPSPSSVRIGAG